MIASRVAVLVLVLRMLICDCYPFVSVRDDERLSTVIKGIKTQFRSNCVSFIKSIDHAENVHILRIQRLLSDRSISSSVIDVTAILQVPHGLPSSCNTPIYAHFADNATRTRLKLISNTKNFAGKIWLLFGHLSVSLDEFFLDVNIPFDCEFIVASPFPPDGFDFTEVYGVSVHLPLQRHHLGSWSVDVGFTWSSSGLYDRRRSLSGVTFKTSINVWPPYALVRGDNSSRLTLGGFAGDIWRILEEHLRFSSAHEIPPDAMWGTLQDGGSWDGIMAAILGGGANMSAVGMTMTPDRADYVTFTIPLFVHNMLVFIREPRRRFSLWDLVSPLSVELWLALLGSAVVSCAILALFYRADEGEPFKDTVFNVFTAIFCTQGLLSPSTAVSTCMVTFLVYMIGVVFLNIYSSFVISSLSAYRPEMPFESIDGILEDGTYSLGMLKIGYPLSAFKNARVGKQEVLKQLFDKHVSRDPNNLQRNNEEAFQRVCKKRFAFMIGEEAPTTVRLNCSVVRLRSRFSDFRNCLAFPRDSPYVGLFNSKLLSLVNSGILRKLHKDAVSTASQRVREVTIFANLKTVTPVLSVLAFGVSAACFILACEILAARLNNDGTV